MSFLTSLSLSFNNLRTKKGRTLLTSFAGSIGIIGILLFIFPYFAILCYSLFKMIKDYKNRFTFLNVSLAGSIVLVFFAGIMSGNVFDEWICTLFLGLICGFLIININQKNKE